MLKTPDQSIDGEINRGTDGRTDLLMDGHNLLQRCIVVAKKKKKLQLGFLANFDVETEPAQGLSTNGMKYRC